MFHVESYRRWLTIRYVRSDANIETVARLEQNLLDHRTTRDRIGDAITGFAGTMKFVIAAPRWPDCLVHGEFRGVVPSIRPFDPYPYVSLTMMVSLEGVLLATFILMKQNRMSRRADQRDHLNLQIDLLAENRDHEDSSNPTANCAGTLDFRTQTNDEEVAELSRHTAVEDLARELEQKLPAD